MKTKDAMFILGNKRVFELYLMQAMSEISNDVRRHLMLAEHFCVTPEKLAELFKNEVLWQAECHKAYVRSLDVNADASGNMILFLDDNSQSEGVLSKGDSL